MNCCRPYFCFLLSLFFIQAFPLPGLWSQVPVHPDHGVALIWYGSQDNLFSRNGIVTAGQIMYMWRDFEPEEGKYRFDDLDANLQQIRSKGLKTTIQINGNRHPDYIYHLVPYLKGVELPSTKDYLDGYGPPMYWHPVYKEKYSGMIRALARHLKDSPYRDVILGIRQSYNAVGTENYYIPPQYRDTSAWTLEKNASWGDLWPWTKETGLAYKTWSIDMYIDAFHPPAETPVFLRASAIADGVASDSARSMVENGKLGIFHTSSEPQPRPGKNDQYKVFVDFAKTGKTYAFMESWSAATTDSDGWNWTKTETPITKAQFNYWTLLCDLHCGATFPAMRPQDVDVPSYREDYEFLARYAGFIAAPRAAPGAWIAFREGDYLKGDYTFLMDRDPADQTLPLYNVDGDKHGLWARRIRTIDPMKLQLDTAFASSISGTINNTLKIWYKDEGTGWIDVRAFGQIIRFLKTGTGEWKHVSQKLIIPDTANRMEISAPESDLIIHMVEVERGDTLQATPTNFRLNTGAGATPGAGIYPCGEFIVIKDSATEVSVNHLPRGYRFSHWQILYGDPVIADSLNPVTTIRLTTDDASVSAVFVPENYAVDLTVEGSGKIAADPVLPEYPFGTDLDLTAVPDSGWFFSAWTGEIESIQNPLHINISDDLALTAVFKPAEYSLHIEITGGGRVISDPAGESFPAGSMVTLTAEPDNDWIFSGWSGDVTGQTEYIRVFMDGDKTVNAIFVEDPYLGSSITKPGESDRGRCKVVYDHSGVQVRIRLENHTRIRHFEVYTSDGVRTIVKAEVLSNELIVNVAGLKAGIYFIRISNGGICPVTTRFIVF